MKRCKILFIGGGSTAAIDIAKDVMLTDSLKNSQIVLYDLNKKACDFNKVFLDRAAREIGCGCEVVSTDEPAAAFKGADYTVITISTGGLTSMGIDLSVAEEYGIYHTVGDTAGPAGWARSIRNYETFVDLAKKINKYCPQTFILNYANPMAFLTDVLSGLCKGPVIGLCRGILENIHAIKGIYKIADESELSLKYAGLNHFFWITEASQGNIDIIADMKKKLRNKTLSELLPTDGGDPINFKEGRQLADQLFRMTGIMPYFGDRHTCEFFPDYITSKANLRNHNIARTSIKQRLKWQAMKIAKIEKMLGTGIPKQYLQRSGETAADVMNAHLTGRRFVDVANVGNIGQISNLPLGTVVETACAIDKNGVSPVCFGDLPEIIAEFCRTHSAVTDMILSGCIEKDKDTLLQALRLDPACSRLRWPQVCQMGEKLLKSHNKFISGIND